MVDSYIMCECPLVCVRATKIMEVTRLLHTRGDIEKHTTYKTKIIRKWFIIIKLTITLASPNNF